MNIRFFQARLLAQANRQATLRNQESEGHRNIRMEMDRERHKIYFQRTWESMNNVAFNYCPKIDYNTHYQLNIGQMSNECTHCKALRYKGEAPGMCCANGKVSLELIEEPPEPLQTLLSGTTEDSKHFLQHTRSFNSCFQMTSFGADRKITQPNFSLTFTIQGQVYHRIGSLLPPIDKEYSFLQIYFMGDEESEEKRRCEIINKKIDQQVKKHIIHSLQELLHTHNNLIKEFKTAKENIPSDDYKIVIRADRVPRGEHERRYNVPTVNEVAILIVGNNSRDIVLCTRDNALSRINDCHIYYDALQYPLIFWKGQPGYHFNIPLINPINKMQLSKGKVTAKDFYAYHLMIRHNHANIFIKFRDLFHQFLVDMYAKIESERLRFIALHQKELRAAQYSNLKDASQADGNLNANDLGKIVILPVSFINSPR